jgi:hypothetical protein
MAFREHAKEPWGLVAAGLLGGVGGAMAAAVGPSTAVGLLVGLAIGGTVYGVRVGLGALGDRSGGARPPDLPEDAEHFLDRAEAAVGVLRAKAKAASDPHLRDLLHDAASRAGSAATGLHESAAAMAVVDTGLAGVEVQELRAEHKRFTRSARTVKSDALRAEKEASARAVAERIVSYERMAEMRQLLTAGVESTVVGLEAVAAQAALLVSMRATSGVIPERDLVHLAEELEAMRAGQAETDIITRRVLGRT